MALGFFRRRKKLVFWIMVALMVVFLLSIGGAQPLIRMFAPRGDDVALGHAGALTVTQRALKRVDGELMLLQRYFGLGNAFREVSGLPRSVPGEKGLLLVLQAPSPNFSWLLLAHEARSMGFRGGKVLQDKFMEAYLNLPPERFKALVAMAVQRGILERHLREALDDYLVIAQAFGAATAGVRETEPGLRRLFDQVRSRMDVAVVKFQADEFTEDVGQADPNELEALFTECKEYFRDDVLGNPHPFRFGYRRSPRVSVEYVLVDYDDVVRSVTLDETKMFEFWKDNEGKFTKEVPLAAADEPTEGEPNTEASTEPNAEPKTETVIITEYQEAKPQIRQILRARQTQRKMADICDRILRLAREYQSPSTADAPQGASPLERAAREVLKSGRKVHYRKTGLLDRQALAADQTLGRAVRGASGRFESLVQLAFNVKELLPDDSPLFAGLQVGKLYGHAMTVVPEDVQQGQRGKLIWVVSEAQPAEVPGSLDEVRAQVVADWKRVRAFDAAKTAADKMAESAQVEGQDADLAELAEAAGKEVETLTDITHRTIAPGGMDDYEILAARQSAAKIAQWVQSGQEGDQPPVAKPEHYLKAALGPRYVLLPSMQIPLDGRDPEHKVFLDAVFSLVPADESADEGSKGVTTVALPAAGVVCVVQRLKYTPAYEQEYSEPRLRAMGLIGPTDEIQRHELATSWFDEEDIIRRTGYKRAEE